VPADDVPADVAPADVPTQNPDEIAALRAELAELRREQVARDRADAVKRGQPIEHPNTHVLVLANGDTVETAHASTTHVSLAGEDGTETVVPVVGRYEITPS
jgi:hypothetical protein